MIRPVADITVYTSEPSKVCARVKGVLDARQLDYTEIRVSTDEERAAMVERTGMMHCPVVIVGDVIVGGLAETIEAAQSGRLAELAAAN